MIWKCWGVGLAAAVLLAQVETARITGTVTDATGALVPGARVTIRSLDTNIEQVTETNAQGRYLSVPLRVGAYEVAVQAGGFKREVHSGIRLQIQQTAVVDFRLQVGQMLESISVTADAPLLQTTDVSQGQVIDNKKIIDLPLNGRDYLQLAALSSGAIPRSGQKGSTGFSANGLRTELNNYMLDGLDNNMHHQAYTGGQAQAVEPSVDAIQEFKVQTSAYSAEFGNNMGAVVNVTLRSGTNKAHGSTFEFLRNEVLDARNFFEQPGARKAPYKQNQFGFTLGGPIRRDKTFFFTDYEGTRRRVAGTVFSNVPTERERRGDFSQSQLRGQAVRIFDPDSYNAATRARVEFPGAVIPPSRLDPVGANAVKLFPLPNLPTEVNNFLYHPVNPLSEDKFDVRIDHTFSAKDSLFGRLSYQLPREVGNLVLPPPAFGSSSQELNSTGRSLALSHTHIFSPALFHTTKLGWNQLLTDRLAPTSENYNRQIGLRGLPYDLPGLAQFNLSNFRSIGTMSGNPSRTDSQVRQLKHDLSWIRGRHTLKTGASLSWVQSPQIHYYQANGVFSFNGNFTRQSSNNQFGDDLADMLLGYPVSSQLSNRGQSALRRRFYHAYIQDEFQLAARLSLSLGLRYEYNSPWVDKYDHLSNFDIDTDPANPRLVVARGGGIAERSTLSPDYLNLAPRGGLAYRIGEKTVARAGYGIYYGGVDHIGDRYLHASPPFFFQSTFSTDNIRPNIILRDGYPPGATTANVTNLQTISQDRRNPTAYSQQWNFTLQRALVSDLSLEMGYVGSRGVHLLQRRDTNAPPPGAGDINSRRPYTSLAVPGLDYIVRPLADTFRREWTANGSYHGLQFKAEKRLSAGLSFLGAYMWSKAIDDLNDNQPDPYNMRLERALSDNHVPHRFVVSYNYDLPFGHGRRLLGGWSIGGITVFSSGNRVDMTVQGNPQNNGRPNRPDILRDPRLAKKERSLGRWFDTSAFVANRPYTFGSAPRNAIEGPGLVNFDFAAYKQFNLTERWNVQFRTELFNATNTPRFGNPNAQVGARNFGIISSAGAPRIIQFGLKLRF
ncbi:MAG: carboxypeptidase regulatory-like domain-containing protein [Acidobacteriota bacterium]